MSTPKVVRLREFLSESMIYGLGGMANKAVGFILLPLSTAYLTTEDYGLLSLAGSTTTLLQNLFTLGLHFAYFRYFLETTDPLGRQRVQDTAFWLATGVMAIGGLACVTVGMPLGFYLFNSYAYLPLLVVLTFLMFVRDMGGFRLQADARAWRFLGISLVSTIFVRGLGVLLVVFGWGAWGWLMGEFAGLFITALLMWKLAFPDLGLFVHRDSAREMLPYGISLVPGVLAHWLTAGCDKYLMRARAVNPMHELGLYSVGERIGSLMELVTLSMHLGWRRFSFQNIQHQEGAARVGRGFTLFAVFAGYGALALILLGDDLTYWLINPRFHDGIPVILPLTLSGLIYAMSELTATGLYVRKHTLLISIVNIVSAVLNVGLNYYLIPYWGMMGAATAIISSQSVRGIGLWVTAAWVAPIPIEYRRLSLVAVVYIAVYYLGQSFQPMGWITAGIVQVVLVVCTPPLLYFLPFLHAEERSRLLQLRDKAWRKLS